MRKIAIYLLVVVILMSTISISLMAHVTEDTLTKKCDSLMNDYFQYRKESILLAQNGTTWDRGKTDIKLSNSVIDVEYDRIKGIQDFLKQTDLRIEDVSISYELLDISYSDNSIHLYVYESIDFVWTFKESNSRIKSGYGTEHDIYVNRNTLEIEKDMFYEKDFSGVSTTDRTDIYTVAEETPVDRVQLVDISNLTSYSMSYSAGSAASYALSYSSSSSGTTSYNSIYKNWAGYGGDCANFVSQCLLAGGLSMVTSGSYVWYYNDAGTACTNPTHGPNASGNWSSHACTADDYASASWIGCSSQRSALVYLFGSDLYGPCYFTNSSVYVGSLLYTNSGGHVYICTDDSSTTRCYTCHTDNLLNWPIDIETIYAYILRP